MRGAVLVALIATTALLPANLAAQTPGPAEPPAATQPAVQPPPTPAAPAPAPPAAAPGPQASGQQRGPANICQELIAFLEPPAPAAQSPAQAQAAAGAPAPAPAQQTAVAAPPQSPAASATTQPGGQGAPSQSGLSGPTPQTTTQGTSGPQAAGQSPAVTQAQPAPQPAAPAAPAAPAGPVAPKPSPAAIEKAKAAAGGNDIAGCRGAAQEMRRAGVALPPPLIALAGLDLKYHQAAQPR